MGFCKVNSEVLKSDLCDYSEASILVKYDITIIGHQVTQVAFKNCVLFINSITKIDGTTINDAENLDLVMPMYNLIEYSPNYSKKQEVYGFILKIKRLVLMLILLIIILNLLNIKTDLHPANVMRATVR